MYHRNLSNMYRCHLSHLDRHSGSFDLGSACAWFPLNLIHTRHTIDSMEHAHRIHNIIHTNLFCSGSLYRYETSMHACHMWRSIVIYANVDKSIRYKNKICKNDWTGISAKSARMHDINRCVHIHMICTHTFSHIH